MSYLAAHVTIPTSALVRSEMCMRMQMDTPTGSCCSG